MSLERQPTPTAGEVLGSVGDAATRLGTYVSKVVDEQPSLALAAALVAGFVAGGGLASRLGARLTTSTLRATFGNLTTLVALDLLRRMLEEGLPRGPEQADPTQ